MTFQLQPSHSGGSDDSVLQHGTGQQKKGTDEDSHMDGTQERQPGRKGRFCTPHFHRLVKLQCIFFLLKSHLSA